MHGTEGLIKATQSAKRPATWRLTAKAAPQRSSDFESVLLAIAGHDLRQPLQVIQSAHELLGLGVRTESEVRLLRFGQSAIDRLKDQLDQLVAALRIRDQAQEVTLTPVPVGPLFREVCQENEIAALRKGVRVRLVDTSATIHSNALLLGTILRNLVSNAIKYTQPGGHILLGCRLVGQSIRIDVYDTGIGIAPDQMPRIFEAFTRLDPARRDGLGVGLFIVREAVAILRHRVDIASVRSHGSRFSIFATKAEMMAVPPDRDGQFRQATSGAQSRDSCS